MMIFKIMARKLLQITVQIIYLVSVKNAQKKASL